MLDPKNADFDGDGLRDGQETAGWTVGVWLERTMEKVRSYNISANATIVDTDSDGMNDFSEFLNGSDPRSSDTDKDGIADLTEIQQKSNITGVEGTPPTIRNVQNSVAVTWEVLLFVPLPTKAQVDVQFDISDNVGIDKVNVKVLRMYGTVSEVHTVTLPAGQKSGHIHEVFSFSLLEAIASGADVNISAYDVNGNGAWGQYHVDSLFEAVLKAIAALFAAIAKVIVDAVSAAFNWIWAAIGALFDPVIRPIIDGIKQVARTIVSILEGTIGGFLAGLLLPTRGDDGATDHWGGSIIGGLIGAFVGFYGALKFIAWTMYGVGLITEPPILIVDLLKVPIGKFLKDIIYGLVGGFVQGFLLGNLIDSVGSGGFANDLLTSAVGETGTIAIEFGLFALETAAVLVFLTKGIKEKTGPPPPGEHASEFIDEMLALMLSLISATITPTSLETAFAVAVLDGIAFYFGLSAMIDLFALKKEKGGWTKAFNSFENPVIALVEFAGTIIGFIVTIADFIRHAFSVTSQPPTVTRYGTVVVDDAKEGMAALYGQLTVAMIGASVYTALRDSSKGAQT